MSSRNNLSRLSKAFDRVPHAKLLEKLKYNGIRGPMLNWTELFLIGRTQKVSVNGIHSSPINVTSGVPQRSVMGPTLFQRYINDINNNFNSTVRLFPDDSLLYHPIWSQNGHTILQKDLKMLLLRQINGKSASMSPSVKYSPLQKRPLSFDMYRGR